MTKERNQLTQWFDGINSFNVGISVLTLISNFVMLIFSEVFMTPESCFFREAAYTSQIYEMMFTFESAIHFFLAMISMCLFIVYLFIIFKTFSDAEFNKIKIRELVCSIVLTLMFGCKSLFAVISGGVVAHSEVSGVDVLNYHVTYDDTREHFLAANVDWLNIVLFGIGPLITMQMMVDYPF